MTRVSVAEDDENVLDTLHRTLSAMGYRALAHNLGGLDSIVVRGASVNQVLLVPAGKVPGRQFYNDKRNDPDTNEHKKGNY